MCSNVVFSASNQQASADVLAANPFSAVLKADQVETEVEERIKKQEAKALALEKAKQAKEGKN